MRMRCFPIALPVYYTVLKVCFPPSSPKPVQIEPALPTDTSSFPCVRSSSRGPMENSMEDPVSAGTELAGLSPEAGDINNLPINSHSGPGSRACSGSPEDGFSHFLYWRTPLPDISKDLELLLSEAGLQEEAYSRPETMHNSCVARSEIQKVLDSLQEHLMSDPDVQGKHRRHNYRADWCSWVVSAGPGRTAYMRVLPFVCLVYVLRPDPQGLSVQVPARALPLVLQPSRCEVGSDTKTDSSWASPSQWKLR